MKKILGLICVCLALCNLVACTYAGTPYGWITRDLSIPTIDLPIQDTEFVLDEETRHDKILRTPIAIDDAQKAVEKLKELDCLQGWKVSTTDNLYGTPAGDSFTTYQKGFRAGFYQNGYDEHIIVIEYTTDTDAFDGWSRVYVHWMHNDSAISQKDALTILQAIYGDYAEYLCYAKMKGKGSSVSASTTTGDASVKLSRESNEVGVSFVLEFENLAQGTVGNTGGVICPNPQMEPLVELLQWSESEANLNDIKMFGKSFFSEIYGEDAAFALTAPYAFTSEYNPLNDTDKQVRDSVLILGEVQVSSTVAHKVSYNYNRYLNEHSDVTIRINTGASNAQESTDEFKERALHIVQKVVPNATEDCFNEGYTANVTLDGRDGQAAFRFYCNTTDGVTSTELLIVASTNPNDFKDTAIQ